MKHKLILISSIFIFAFAGSAKVDAQWVQTTGPSGNGTNVVCLMASDTTLFAGTDYGGVFLTTDAGAEWVIPNNTGLTDLNITALAMIDTNIFAGTSDPGVFLSINSGTNWTAVNPTPVNASSFAISGTDIYVGTLCCGVHHSTDNGASWNSIDNGLPADSGIVALAAIGTTIFAADNVNHVYVLNDSGTRWILKDTGLNNGGTAALYVSGTNLYALGYDGGIGFSSDSGKSWSDIGVKNTNIRWMYSLFVTGSSIFAGTDHGVYLSMDNGKSWANASAGLPGTPNKDTNAYSLAVIGNNIFAGTDSGVWIRPLSQMIPTNSVSGPQILSSEIESYPNPFSQSTTINFSIPESGVAEVSVVNILGTEVGRIFSGELQSGEHSFSWDASGMQPGMYECVVRMNRNAQRVSLAVVR